MSTGAFCMAFFIGGVGILAAAEGARVWLRARRARLTAARLREGEPAKVYGGGIWERKERKL